MLIKLKIYLATIITSLILSGYVLAQDEPSESHCVSTTKPDTKVEFYNLDYCTILKIAITFKTKNNGYIRMQEGKVNYLESECGKDGRNSELRIDFPCGSLTLTAHLNGNNSTYIESIIGVWKAGALGPVGRFSSLSSAYFVTSEPGNYYKCDSEQEIPMIEGGSLYVSNFALELLRDSRSLKFYKIPEECKLNDISLLVLLGLLSVVIAVFAIIAVYIFKLRD